MSVPLVAGSVIGLRSWRVVHGDLMPLTVQSAPPWRPGVNECRCYVNVPELHRPCVPGCPACLEAIALAANGHTFDARCVCGFYGVFRPDSVPFGMRSGFVIAGVVEVYGRMVLGPTGFKASKARVLALASHPDAPPWPPPLRDEWRGRPHFRDLRDAVAEFPLTDPTPYLQ